MVASAHSRRPLLDAPGNCDDRVPLVTDRANDGFELRGKLTFALTGARPQELRYVRHAFASFLRRTVLAGTACLALSSRCLSQWSELA